MVDAARSNGRLAGWLIFVGLFSAINYAGNFTTDPPDDALYQYRVAIGGAIQFAVMAGILMLIAIEAPKRELFAFRRPTSWSLALGIAAGVYVAMLALGAIISLFLDPSGEQGLIPDEWEPERIVALALNFVVIAGFAPVVEEMMFRGLGFSLLERFGQAFAIVAVGLLFAAAHGLVEAFPLLAAFGVGLALLRARTASIYPCIVLHAFFNASTLVYALVAADRS